jgi:uncharacterized iron-regulated membrane protein
MGIYVIWQRWKRNSPRNKEWLTRRKNNATKRVLTTRVHLNFGTSSPKYSGLPLSNTRCG